MRAVHVSAPNAGMLGDSVRARRQMTLKSKAGVYSVHPVCRLDSAARVEERPSTGGWCG